MGPVDTWLTGDLSVRAARAPPSYPFMIVISVLRFRIQAESEHEDRDLGQVHSKLVAACPPAPGDHEGSGRFQAAESFMITGWGRGEWGRGGWGRAGQGRSGGRGYSVLVTIPNSWILR